MLVSIYAEKEETTIGYMKLFELLYRAFGIPMSVRTDKRTCFSYKRNDTELARQIIKKGTEVSSASYGEFKLDVERTNRTLQPWLIIFLRDNNIKTIDQINENAHLIINKYNEHFNKKIGDKLNFFIKPKDEMDTKLYLSIDRKFNNGVIQFQNKFYIPVTDDNKYKIIQNGVELRFVHNSNNEYFFIINNKLFKARILRDDELTEFQKFCKTFHLFYDDKRSECLYRATKASKDFLPYLRKLIDDISNTSNCSNELLKENLNMAELIYKSLSDNYKLLLDSVEKTASN
ncbi:hypothetical protein [Mycoplasmopsis caviae]|uniref:Integrase catalytic domain-containing protein n=2 Tax=Mycoplasmopsis caviae TaxID=55603 RepID=A0A3P8KCJ4_9BACT|nr:hypothetical protein [Mycoplasmopsis caviae]VDR42254.1 Uncharacterised protein [Mycoplasmopsis caviae]